MAKIKANTWIFREAALLILLAAAAAVVGSALYAWRTDDLRSHPHLKNLAIDLIMYANDHDEYYPPLWSESGRLMFEPDEVYPEYISYPSYLLSPADPLRAQIGSNAAPAFYFQNSSYFYLGYTVWDDATVAAFALAYRQRHENGLRFDEAAVPVDHELETLRRLGATNRRETMLTFEQPA